MLDSQHAESQQRDWKPVQLEQMRMVGVGVLLNSALYLFCAFVAGIYYGNGSAWKLALAAMGVTYLCYDAQLMTLCQGIRLRVLIPAFTIVSMLLGLAAGLALLFL